MKQQERQTKSILALEKTYSGPLPLPEDLAKYDRVVPGAAERILRMAENESEHRRKRDNRMDWSIIITTILSVVFAFLSIIALSVLAYFALEMGYPTAASSFAVGAMAAVAGVFIYKSKKKAKE